MTRSGHNRGIRARIVAWWRRVCKGKHVHVIDHVHERSKELNALLVERRLKRGARASASELVDMPERWHSIMLADLVNFAHQAREPERATLLPDRAWGILQEAAEHFAADAKQLTDDDLLALQALLQDGEAPEHTTLATLRIRKHEKSAVAERMRITHMKVTGRQ